MNDIREPKEKNESGYVLYTMAEDKDLIIDMLLNRAGGLRKVSLPYTDVAKELNISRDQYDAILKEFVADGLVTRVGDSERVTLQPGIYNKHEAGGYSLEKEARMESLECVALQLEKLRSESSPSALAKIDAAIGKAKDVSELLVAIRSLVSDLLHN